MREQAHNRSVSGQALVEFLVIFWFAFSLLMLIIQISLMFNAHSMLKLAAFNAARAAIVARSSDGPEKPVKLSEMQDVAKKAAFLTIIPVIPGMHARVKNFGDILNLFTSMPADLSSALSGGAQGILGGYSHGLAAVAVEYFGQDISFTDGVQPNFNVKFVRPAGDPNPPGAEIKNIPQQIEFDDTSKTNLNDPHGNNLIKVVVEWRYPLVIPLADQIIYAFTHGLDLIIGYAQSSPGTLTEVALGTYKRRPVWEVGWVFRSSASTFTNLFGFRVPLRQSYVMRMQWDRAKGK
jgi:hypothetical protein